MGTSRFIEPLESRRLLAATMVKDLVPGPGSSNPTAFVAVGDKLYFFAAVGSSTIQDTLFVSDGTAAGTVPLQNYVGSPPETMFNFNGKLIFTADSTLWEFDTATNQFVTLGNSGGERFKDFVAAGKKMYFGDYTGLTLPTDTPTESFWTSDGTTSGTIELVEGVNPSKIAAVGSKAFFINYDPSQVQDKSDLWVSDGTKAGTRRFFRQYTSNIATLGTRLLFSVSNAVESGADAGLWITDGTIAGTQRLLPQDPNSNGLGDIMEMCAVGSQVYFADALGQLWRTDGTSAGTALVKTFGHVPGTSITLRMATGAIDLFNFNGTLIFGGDPPADDNVQHHELWRSDGTPAGTYALSAIGTRDYTKLPRPSDPFPYDFTVVGKTLFFTATIAGHPDAGVPDSREVFVTDGRTVSHAPTDFPAAPFVVGSDLYFDNTTRARGTELWKINAADVPGNLAGTLFNDADADNVQAAAESGAGGRVVYLDANNNGQFDAGELNTTTTRTGRFTFNELPPGKYRVRLQQLPGHVAETAPRLAVVSFGTRTIHIGVVPSANVHGVVFNDANHKAIFDAGDTGIANARLYLDANGNHAFDAGERNVHTGSDGSYEFDDLPPGTYALRASAILGLIWTTPTARTTTLAVGGSLSRNFGGYFI